MTHSEKILSREEAVRLRDSLREDGKTVVFTNGCFDLLHIGHISLLEFAGGQGDVLMVGVNSDRTVREIKGPDRPVNREDVRLRILAALQDVDYVFIFDDASVLKTVEMLKPDVLVKGGDYSKEGVVGWQAVEDCGGKVVLAPVVPDASTTGTVNRIREDKEEA